MKRTGNIIRISNFKNLTFDEVEIKQDGKAVLGIVKDNKFHRLDEFKMFTYVEKKEEKPKMEEEKPMEEGYDDEGFEMITSKQKGYAFVLFKEKGISEEDRKAKLTEMFGKNSMKDLTKQEGIQLIDWLTKDKGEKSEEKKPEPFKSREEVRGVDVVEPEKKEPKIEVKEPRGEVKKPIPNVKEESREIVLNEDVKGGFIVPATTIGSAVELFKLFERAKTEILSDNDVIWIGANGRPTDKGMGHPHIKRPGWRKLARFFGLSCRILEKRKEWTKDKEGEYYIWTYKVRAIHPSGAYQEAEGVCTSRDPFFSKRRGERIEPEEENIMMKAQTVGFNRAISDLLGSGEVSAEELGKE